MTQKKIHFFFDFLYKKLGIIVKQNNIKNDIQGDLENLNDDDYKKI